MKNKVLIYSFNEFNTICSINKWDDNNIELNNDVAIISIINSSLCNLYNEKHWFKTNHSNVLNLEFDDVDGENLNTNALPFSIDDANKAIDFIEKNMGKMFLVHCSAGKSRSQGFFRFMTNIYNEVYSEDCGRKDNPCLYPNYYVVKLLKDAYNKKHNSEIIEK